MAFRPTLQLEFKLPEGALQPRNTRSQLWQVVHRFGLDYSLRTYPPVQCELSLLVGGAPTAGKIASKLAPVQAALAGWLGLELAQFRWQLGWAGGYGGVRVRLTLCRPPGAGRQ